MAEAAIRQGYDVYLITRVVDYGEKIEKMGIKLLPIRMDRHNKNVLKEIALVFRIISIYRCVQPDIIHNISLKPVLYGMIAAVFTKVSGNVNTFPGMGYIFRSTALFDRFICFIMMRVLRLLFAIRRGKVIVQNKEDYGFMVENKINGLESTYLIRGSGVDLNEYNVKRQQYDTDIVLFASRLLRQKGVEDFVSSARITKTRFSNLRFVIAGEPDKDNPNSVSSEQLKLWHEQGDIEWLGYVDNMNELFSSVKIIVLPTFYGEGIPKVLIEAASCCIPIVATDVPGCREIVNDGINGFLVPVGSPELISEKILQLVQEPVKCIEMGNKGRELVAKYFSIDQVNKETLAVYSSMLS